MARGTVKKSSETLDDILKRINKTSGSNIVSYGIPERDYDRIPFTSPRMNYCTYGGLPRGRLIEFYGEEHGGKTTTALDIVANFQQIEMGKDEPTQAAYFDVENTLDVKWAKKLGVDVDSLIVFQPETETAEDIFQTVLDMIETRQIGLVVIDSIAALVSDQEMDKDMSERTYAGISMPLTVFGRKAELLCKKTNCSIIGINQLRDDLRATWGDGTKTPGGRAWRHLCTVRMKFTRGSFIDNNGKDLNRSSESPSGNIILMQMDKNKTCPPNRRGGYYTIRYDSGIDYLTDLINVAEKYGLIQQSGAWFSIVDPDTGEVVADKLQGSNRVREYLEDEEHEETLVFIENYIDSKI